MQGREALLVDLERAVQASSAAQTLAIFVVGGLENFRELYGRFEADAVLELIAGRLADQLDGRARLYEPRRGEFAVLDTAPTGEVEDLLELVADELSHRFKQFDLGAACGVVRVPDEASGVAEAITLADRRLAERAVSRQGRDRRREPRS